MAQTPTPLYNPLLVFQPKQGDVLDLAEGNDATWIGGGGGRGGAKSRCVQSVMLARRLANPGTLGTIVMRNSDQVRKYHEDAMLRAWPQLRDCYHKGDRKITLPFANGAPSQIEFNYAETLDDVIRRFRSANYFDIAVDQAEQFTEEELREIKQAVRWPDVPEGTCKLILAFNMGGVGIGFLRKKFHDDEFNEREDPKSFAFVHFFPYDNCEWVRPALQADGLTVEDYYSWPISKRREYCATRSDYGKALVSQDEALVARDFDGSWDSLEGAYFTRSFDRNASVRPPEDIREMIKPWWERWLSQDWARGHYCITYWHAMGEMSPMEIKKFLGWDVRYALKVIITYREYVAGGEAAPDSGGGRELDEEDIARKIVELTPETERKQLPDAFGKKNSKNTIAQTEGEILMASEMPYPRAADNDLEGGWGLMSKLMLATKRKGQRGEEVWLISANCVELVSAIPLAMRDPKRLEVILKTDIGAAKIEMDCLDSCFVAGTLIWTARGQVPIEQVRWNDYVMTRSGWRRVVNAWKNRAGAPIVRALFSDGREIHCTPDHEFWTDRGFLPLNTVRYGDELMSWSSLNLTAMSTKSARMGTTLVEKVSCIGRYGFKPSVVSQVGCTSTIRNAVQRALRMLTIWSASLRSNMRPSMALSASPKPRSIWLKPPSQQKIGTTPLLEKSGTEDTPRYVNSVKRSWFQKSVIAAMETSKEAKISDSAPTPASQSGAETIKLIMSRSLASFVAMLFSGISTTRCERAASNAVRLCGLETAGFADVYDLEVEDAHEFFANGILVHNCRYGLKSKLEPGKKPKAVENEEKLRAMQESGLDGHSLNIYRIQLSQEVRTSEEPARLGHGRVGRRM